jgi:hypothetical protein
MLSLLAPLAYRFENASCGGFQLLNPAMQAGSPVDTSWISH